MNTFHAVGATAFVERRGSRAMVLLVGAIAASLTLAACSTPTTEGSARGDTSGDGSTSTPMVEEVLPGDTSGDGSTSTPMVEEVLPGDTSGDGPTSTPITEEFLLGDASGSREVSTDQSDYLANYLEGERRKVPLRLEHADGLYSDIAIGGAADAEAVAVALDYTYSSPFDTESLNMLEREEEVIFEARLGPMVAINNYGLRGRKYAKYTFLQPDGTVVSSHIVLQQGYGDYCAFEPDSLSSLPETCNDAD